MDNENDLQSLDVFKLDLESDRLREEAAECLTLAKGAYVPYSAYTALIEYAAIFNTIAKRREILYSIAQRGNLSDYDDTNTN